MKKLFITSLVSMLAFTALPTFAAETNKTVLEQVAQDVKVASGYTNLNEVIVDMLKGVKVASGEVYSASKTAITKSVDFTIEQTPLVVKEFLTWRMVSSCVWGVVWILVAGIFFLISYKLTLYMPKADTRSSYGDPSEHNVVGFFKWITLVIGMVLIIISIATNGKTIAKIKVAPRVYLIEYVVDQINSTQNSR